jgi:hypothetical protein
LPRLKRKGKAKQKERKLTDVKVRHKDKKKKFFEKIGRQAKKRKSGANFFPRKINSQDQNLNYNEEFDPGSG